MVGCPGTLPPFLMAGVRFLLAGAILYWWARHGGAPRPERVHWKMAAVLAVLLLSGGNGGVVWAQQRVPFDLAGGSAVDPLGAAVVVLASLSWAVGSLWTARGAPLPKSPMLTTGMEMLIGGALFMVIGTAAGEWSGVSLSSMSLKSVLALLYLVFFRAIVAFTAYVYLLQHTTPSKASTYAYVNPVIAVFLGWAFAGEELSGRVALAALVIVSAVVMITRFQAAAKPVGPEATSL